MRRTLMESRSLFGQKRNEADLACFAFYLTLDQTVPLPKGRQYGLAGRRAREASFQRRTCVIAGLGERRLPLQVWFPRHFPQGICQACSESNTMVAAESFRPT